MPKDPAEERKEDKPVKLFTISAFVFDDGVISGQCIEYRTLGRLKNQKCIVPDRDDFISSVRSLIPSTLPAVEKLINHIFDDLEVEDTLDCEKIGKVVVDIYNDGYVDSDFGEVIKGMRGAPKTWRLEPHDFFRAIEARVGQLSPPFKALIEDRPMNLIDSPSDESIDDGEEEIIVHEDND